MQPRPIQDLQSMVSQQKLEVESQLRSSEHQAERLRIEIVSLRERLDQEMAARSELQGKLDGEREERDIFFTAMQVTDCLSFFSFLPYFWLEELLQASFNSIQSELERLQQGQEEGSERQVQNDASSRVESSSVPDGNKP
uniref:Uncharacterized protein n=1 Tax=Sphaerodactylus townsendi TaxID=933632 RepID=A0ACB8EWK6_9SAUR